MYCISSGLPILSPIVPIQPRYKETKNDEEQRPTFRHAISRTPGHCPRRGQARRNVIREGIGVVLSEGKYWLQATIQTHPEIQAIRKGDRERTSRAKIRGPIARLAGCSDAMAGATWDRRKDFGVLVSQGVDGVP